VEKRPTNGIFTLLIDNNFIEGKVEEKFFGIEEKIKIPFVA